MPKINQLIEETIIENGQVKTKTSNKLTTWESEPSYVKLYLDTVLYLKDLQKGYNPVLMAILKRLPWANQSQDIAINSGVKRIMAKELNCSVSRIDHAITDFVKGELLYRVETGVYQVNPHIFGKGDWADIAKLRLEITFDAKGKTIMGTIEKKTIQEKESRSKISHIIPDPDQVNIDDLLHTGTEGGK
jgi:hypothetical protein